MFLTAMAANAKISGGSKIVDVVIQNFAFSFMSVKILAYYTIQWNSMDSVDNTVEGSIFTSGAISKV